MPKPHNIQYPIILSEEFIEALEDVWSDSVFLEIESTIGSLRHFPELGSPNVRECLIKQYGNGLRKLVVSNFVIIYKFDDEIVTVLALVYGPTII